MNQVILGRRSGGKSNSISITEIPNSLVRTTGVVASANGWGVLVIKYKYPINISKVVCHSGAISYSASIVIKDENGNILGSSILRPLPVTINLDDDSVKEIYLSVQYNTRNHSYCDVNDKRIFAGNAYDWQ